MLRPHRMRLRMDSYQVFAENSLLHSLLKRIPLYCCFAFIDPMPTCNLYIVDTSMKVKYAHRKMGQ
jgi:hypothetical protein